MMFDKIKKNIYNYGKHDKKIYWNITIDRSFFNFLTTFHLNKILEIIFMI